MKLKWQQSEHKNPMTRARGLGSAHSGVDHWLMQKITAISNIILVLWAVWSVVGLVGASYGEFQDWLAQPLNAVLMILFIVSTFYHATLGLQVVVEDYVHCEVMKLSSLIGIKLGLAALAIAAIYSILKLTI
jgi:succinate dehydrogenase / fumarate reductase membrane anchor subunit